MFLLVVICGMLLGPRPSSTTSVPLPSTTTQSAPSTRQLRQLLPRQCTQRHPSRQFILSRETPPATRSVFRYLVHQQLLDVARSFRFNPSHEQEHSNETRRLQTGHKWSTKAVDELRTKLVSLIFGVT